MIKIVITAGGTSEDIDGVRKITNISTGSLGWHCLEAVLDFMHKTETGDFCVYYILTSTAVKKHLPDNVSKHVEFIPTTDAESVYSAVKKVVSENRIDYFIHSMAISDFTFSYAVSIFELAREIEGLQSSHGFTNEDVRYLLENPASKYSANEKISSKDDLILGLKQTKKVIPLIKEKNKDTFLVGFKLLRDVKEKDLLSEAGKLATQNDCDMVFANETSSIGETNHKGILIKNGVVIAQPEGKENIAETIVENMFASH